MKGILMLCLALLTLSATPEEQQRVYQTDAYGRIPAHLLQRREDGRIVEVQLSGSAVTRGPDC